ncbi:MAG: phosphoserine transaminase [Alphaproteobacteria bacterium]|nr:phosphoserine transaminase [Alphaproteobacteria bacterium]
MKKPTIRPESPFFSSGPCAKRPGWSLDALKDAAVGRSHRSKPGKAKLAEALTRSRDLLGLPPDYRIGIVPGSNTGAFEMAIWSMLGERGVDVLAWESFGKGWLTDITKQLKLKDVRSFEADYGVIPDLSQVDTDRDVVFTWNGTTSGVRVPDGAWIASDRKGLTFCDATSAVFAMALPWDKLDVTTYSWQKVMGGEAAHGVLILSPRAVDRLESYTPDWPLPKVFRMTKGGKLIEGIFAGETINTPSMLCVEDAIDALKWMENAGGTKAIVAQTEANLAAIAGWVEKTPWIEFLVEEPAIRSATSVCFKVEDAWFAALDAATQTATLKGMVGMLEKEGVAYDIGGYRDAPPGLRIWAGATVKTADLEALFPWLDWAFAETKANA